MIVMGDETPDEDAPQDQSLSVSGGLPDTISETAITLTTGVPPQIQRSFFKAVGRVLTAGAEWPAKYLEGKGKEVTAKSELKAARYKAETADIVSQQKARDVVNRGTAKVALSVFSENDMAQRAAEFHAAHILREQSIREDIINRTAEDLNNNPPSQDSNIDIDDDWLSAFLKEASTRSTEEYRDLFSRILAGEVKSPGSFSIGTVQSISRMNSRTADIFQKACNISSSLFDGHTIRIISDDFCNIGNNHLTTFGLSYDNFSILVEEGLMRPELGERSSLIEAMYQSGFPFKIGAKDYLLKRNPDAPKDNYTLHLAGPSFTRAGSELRTVVNMETSDEYVIMLAKWLKNNNFELYEVIRQNGGKTYGNKIEV